MYKLILMTFTPTSLKGLLEVNIEKREDDRGFFARFFCVDEYAAQGVLMKFIQINVSSNKRRHTLRGMHYQLPPRGENRIVSCLRGSAFDVSLDLRPNSTTFGKYYTTHLSADNRKMMFIPNGFAHGYLTLEDSTDFIYLNTESYAKEYDRVIRWNDSKFNIPWPTIPEIISPRDATQSDFDSVYHLTGMETLKS